MPILRIKKRDNPFVQIDKRPINDERLTWKAKGMLVYLLSKPNDWKVWVTDLVKRAHDGKASVRSGIQELMDRGYVERKQLRDDHGRITEWEYTVYELPLTDFQHVDNQELDNQHLENRTLTNIDPTNSETKEICPAAAGDARPFIIGQGNGKPAAVNVYRAFTNLWPRKPLWDDIDLAVGFEAGDLEFWGLVVHAWMGVGWNPKNVKGMLEFYQRREIPGGKPKRTSSQRQAPDPQSFISGKFGDSIRR